MSAPASAPASLSPQERKAARRLRDDPVFFVEEALGAPLWGAQEEIHASVAKNRRTAVRSCHGAGKSYAAARVAVWYLLTRPFSIVATTAPTARQVRKILWQEIRRAAGGAKLPLCRTSPLLTEWSLDDGWYALGLATDDPDAFSGLHAPSGDILIVIDEASGVEDPIWEAIDGCLSSRGARLLSIGNPLRPKGAFFDEFKAPGVSKIRISAFDTPNFTELGITREDIRSGAWEKKAAARPLPYPSLVTPEWVAEKLRKWGEGSPLWRAKVEGEFPENEEDTLIPLSWVEAAKERWLEFEELSPEEQEASLVPGLPVELGLDVARYGRNESCLVLREGMRARVYSAWRGKPTTETTGRACRALDETGASVVKVDDIGIGGGVTDRLRELGRPVEPVNAGGAPVTHVEDEDGRAAGVRFFDRRAEMWWTVRELFRQGAILLEGDDDVLEAQLVAPRYSFTSKGRIRVESKEDLEKRDVESPDRADAFCLAFAPSASEWSLRSDEDVAF